MSYIRFGNKLITTPIETILNQVRVDTNNKYLHDIRNSNSGLRITCPFHGDGNEQTPDCFINIDPTSDLYGVFHCFACGAKGYITDIINYCFRQSGDFAQQWLIDNFADIFIEHQEILPEIVLYNNKSKECLDESILSKYRFIHPYILQRGISEDVVKKFSVGYDKDDDSIVFPVWDEHNNLRLLTKRSVKGKNFFIQSGINKPIYLLNFVLNEHITTVYVVESQINALTLWTWGYPAIALLGTGSNYQYSILNKSGIRNYILCFDGDFAGDNGIRRFVHNMSSDVLINIKQLPKNKDVNDLSKSEFDSLKIVDKFNYL